MKMQDPWMSKTPRLRRALIHIQGMAGPRCASSVASALGLVAGVAEVEVSLDDGHAAVFFDPRKADLNQFSVAVRAVGFRSEVVEDAMTA